ELSSRLDSELGKWLLSDWRSYGERHFVEPHCMRLTGRKPWRNLLRRRGCSARKYYIGRTVTVIGPFLATVSVAAAWLAAISKRLISKRGQRRIRMVRMWNVGDLGGRRGRRG